MLVEDYMHIVLAHLLLDIKTTLHSVISLSKIL